MLEPRLRGLSPSLEGHFTPELSPDLQRPPDPLAQLLCLLPASTWRSQMKHQLDEQEPPQLCGLHPGPRLPWKRELCSYDRAKFLARCGS